MAQEPKRSTITSTTVQTARPESSFSTAWRAVKHLADKFSANELHFVSSSYQEAELRTEFLNKFFIALGWDVLHDYENDPYRQEVKIERSDHRALGRADYAFSLAPSYQRIRFLVEAKRPQLDIATPDNCFQAVRYSWPLGLPIVVLSDFKSLHIIDSRFKPNINSATDRIVTSWVIADYKNQDKFEKIYWLLSREAVAQGSLERFERNELPAEGVAVRQYSLFPGEVRSFDDDFLGKLNGWRFQLATMFKNAQSGLSGKQLTEIVQRTLDRLIFIRFLEDKGIEPDQIITGFGNRKKPAWIDFIASTRRLDTLYNGVVFKPHPILDNANFQPSSTKFSEICDELTDDHSPYDFGSIPIEVLGRIYEQFLGKTIEFQDGQIEVHEKADVRKAGGVYYTPDYIVNYMVENSLGKLIINKSIDQILSLRVIDTSCGSGSFLIASFAYLISAILLRLKDDPSQVKKRRAELRDGEYHLTMSFKREVLTKCIYGVDIDPQAVEVAQLSLYLKLMDDETTSSAHTQQIEMGAALLPSLNANIVEGNSLITLDEELFPASRLRELKSLDFHKTFPRAFDDGGFDLLIGNPPYIKEYTNKGAFEHLKGLTLPLTCPRS